MILFWWKKKNQTNDPFILPKEKKNQPNTQYY